jgi:hypothetical protein
MNTANTAAGIEMGKTVELGTVRIHRFADHFRVTDLTNAGKRGKRCAVASLATTHLFTGDQSAWMHNMGRALVSMCESYSDVRRLIADIMVDFPGELRFDAREERGVDVEPAGAQTLTVKTAAGLVITASDRDFSVKSSWAISKSATQDTLYYPAGTKTEQRAGAARFFAWLRANLSKVETMTISDLCAQWNALEVRHDYH